MPDFLPRGDAELLQWSKNFDQQIQQSGEQWSLSPQQIAEYSLRHAAFAEAFRIANDPTQRTTPTISGKNGERASLKKSARHLARILRAVLHDDPATLIVLGLKSGEGRRQRVGAPSEAPTLWLTTTLSQREVIVNLRDASTSGRRGKPSDVEGAMIFMFVGNAPPSDLSQWRFCMGTTRNQTTIRFGPEIKSGSQVWIAASWYNRRHEQGPWSRACSTMVHGLAMGPRRLAA